MDPTRTAAAAAGTTLFQNTGDSAGLIPTIEFVGGPVPETRFVNVSRTIQFDLTGTCPAFNNPGSGPGVELYIGDEFAGGTLWTMDRSFPSTPRPPDGHCMWAFRFQSEVDRIPAGQNLRVRVLFYGRFPADSTYERTQFLVQGVGQSVLRIPFYGRDDAQFRIPDLQAPASNGDSSDPGAARLAVIGFALLVAGPPLLVPRLARRRGLAIIVVLVLLAGSAGGCLGRGGASRSVAGDGAGPDVQGNATSVIVTDGGAAPSPGKGSILGVVHDDLVTPVGGAYVALLGTSRFASTDREGRFRLDGIAPADYVLRVDREGYRSVESKIHVVADRLTKVTVQLDPIVPRNALPHRHDQWGGATTRTWFETDVVFDKACVQVWLALPARSCHEHIRLPEAAEDGSAIVLPGTYDVEVTVSWGSTTNVPWMMLGFMANHDPGIVTTAGEVVGNWTEMYPKKNGVPTHLRTSWEMSDFGHQVFSTWDLSLSLPMFGVASAHDVSAPFRVKAVLHKGVVPLEPAHRDFWAGKPSLPVLEEAALQIPCPGCGNPGTYPNPYAAWNPYRLVPPGTKTLEITLEQDRASQPDARDWGLLYRPANVAPQPEGDFSKFVKLTPTSQDASGLKKQYRLEIQPEEADPFYAKKSFWEFVLDDGKDGSVAISNGPVTFLLTVTAFPGPDAQDASGPVRLLLPD